MVYKILKENLLPLSVAVGYQVQQPMDWNPGQPNTKADK